MNPLAALQANDPPKILSSRRLALMAIGNERGLPITEASTTDEVDQWMTKPTPGALKLQRL